MEAIVSLSAAPPETEGTSLRGGRLGVIGIVFYVIAAASPLVGMTGALPVAIVLGNGAAVPGAYLAVGIVLLLFSVGYATMSQQVTNTGAFFAYVGRGLGIGPGVGSAYVSLVAYLAIQLAIFGFFGAVMSAQMDAKLGINLSWWVWTLISWAVVLLLSAFSVDVGAKVLGVLMLVELGSLVLVSVAVFVQGGGPDGVDFGASFAPDKILVGGLSGSAGIALAFAFASFIGFEATAIYGEEARDPKRAVPVATYLAVTIITVLFAATTFAVISAMGAAHAVDETVKRSSVDGVPLADSAQVIFSVARQYVGGWLADLMSWLVLSSLFAGMLAFQNSAARYFFSMGRAGVLPKALDRVNKAGAPLLGSIVTSVITGVVIVLFAVTGKDPVLNLFFWFSGLAVVAIVLVEVLVCFAVIAFFRRHPEKHGVWKTVIAPILAAIGLVLGEYLLMSRFGLLAGTVAKGVDPTAQAWGLNFLGYTLILLPFIVFVLGTVVGTVRRRGENAAAVADLVG
jgi:amino acid transporter